MAKIRELDYNTSYVLPGEKGEKRTVLKYDSRFKNGQTQVYAAPYVNGVLQTSRGYWIDWNTEVEVVQ